MLRIGSTALVIKKATLSNYKILKGKKIVLRSREAQLEVDHRRVVITISLMKVLFKAIPKPLSKYEITKGKSSNFALKIGGNTRVSGQVSNSSLVAKMLKHIRHCIPFHGVVGVSFSPRSNEFCNSNACFARSLSSRRVVVTVQSSLTFS